MASFRIRPKFTMNSSKNVEEIISLIKDKLKLNDHHIHGQAMQDHITIRVNKSHRHYWSPQLSVQLHRESGDDFTKITGIYGPMPNVWTLFSMSYLAMGTIFIFVCIMGFSQKALGQEHKILWVLPLIIILVSALYFISQLGQKLGASQTYKIHYFFREALEEEIPDV